MIPAIQKTEATISMMNSETTMQRWIAYTNATTADVRLSFVAPAHSRAFIALEKGRIDGTERIT